MCYFMSLYVALRRAVSSDLDPELCALTAFCLTVSNNGLNVKSQVRDCKGLVLIERKKHGCMLERPNSQGVNKSQKPWKKFLCDQMIVYTKLSYIQNVSNLKAFFACRSLKGSM